MSITLDDRLQTCADFVRERAVLADVGTDHAYLPVYLIQQGKISFALACDINKQPLLSAKETVTEYGVDENVSLRLCDGLEGIDENEFSDLVIAGMGGELIIKILQNCSYIKNSRYRLILQPMSKVYDLRRWLVENGFEISDEKAASANNKIYTVLCVQYFGENSQQSEEFYHFGKLLEKEDEKSKEYVDKTKKSLIKRAKGILSADNENKQAKELLSLCERI